MAQIIYPNYNGVYTSVFDVVTPATDVDAGADAILIAGVAQRGPINRPVDVNDQSVKEIFGNSDDLTPSEFEKSAVRAYEEIRAAQNGDGNIRIMRVGNSRRATMDLYENRTYTSGNLSYTDDSSNPRPTLRVEAFEDGPTEFTCEIEGDELGMPIRAKMSLDVVDEDGTERIVNEILQLDVTGQEEGKLFRSTQLAAFINLHEDYGQYVFAGVPMIEHTEDIAIIQNPTAPSGIIQKVYDIEPAAGIGTGSFGDKLNEVLEVWNDKTVNETVSAGSSTYTAERVINKSADVSVPSIPEAYVVKSNEIIVQNIELSQVGNDTASLGCTSDNSWNFGGSDPIKELEIVIVRGGVSSTLTVSDYSINLVTGLITFETGSGKAVEGGFQLNDTISASYKYLASFAEAKTREDIVRGSKRSYFVIGKDIIFGSPLNNDVEIDYNATIKYEVGPDVIINDSDEAKIEFINAANQPLIGDTVYVKFDYEPELPAIAGYEYPDGRVQVAATSGGSAGTTLSKADYKDAVKKAFEESENYSGRIIIVSGAYFDDQIDGYNYNTGLPETQNIGWHSLLQQVAERKSTYVSECEFILGAYPMTPDDLTSSGGYTKWLKRMTQLSSSDPKNSANVANVIKDFRCSIVVGEILGSKLNGTTEYPLYAPNVIAAMKSETPASETLTHKQLPGNVTRMRFLIKSANDIDKLNGMRYTTLGIETSGVLDEAKSPVKIMDAPTMAQAGSQFDRQSTYASMIEGLKTIRTTLKPFIGKFLDAAILKTIDNRLNAELQGLVPTILRAYTIKVSASKSQILQGTTAVRFNAITGSEIRRFAVDATASKVA